MTREEAIEILKAVDENASCDECLYYAQMEDCPIDDDCIIRKAIWVAIQALSQEPCTDAVPMSVIEDIKAEIQDKQWFFTSIIVNHVIAIIDKHIKEQTE